MTSTNPAIAAFAAHIGEGITFAQVRVLPEPGGYELRHLNDREIDKSLLRTVTAVEARGLSQFTETGVFRPLKSSPDLPSGWRLEARGLRDLEFALNQLYPGAVADWYAAQQNPHAATDYRTYTERQTGMYRVTCLVTDSQAREIALACCDARFCLKRRLWTINALAGDSPETKSLIPCLEPCAVLMEFARTAFRADQEEPVSQALRSEDAESMRALIKQAGSTPSTGRQADFSDPLNPRRLQLLLRKISPAHAEPVTAVE